MLPLNCWVVNANTLLLQQMKSFSLTMPWQKSALPCENQMWFSKHKCDWVHVWIKWIYWHHANCQQWKILMVECIMNWQDQMCILKMCNFQMPSVKKWQKQLKIPETWIGACAHLQSVHWAVLWCIWVCPHEPTCLPSMQKSACNFVAFVIQKQSCTSVALVRVHSWKGQTISPWLTLAQKKNYYSSSYNLSHHGSLWLPLRKFWLTFARQNALVDVFGWVALSQKVFDEWRINQTKVLVCEFYVRRFP